MQSHKDFHSIQKDLIKTLIQKYSKNIPRYTSYPTAVEFNNTVSNETLRETISKEFSQAKDLPISLYTHIPFCHSLCYFCACNKVIPKDRNIVGDYLQALNQEVLNFSEIMPKNLIVEQFHWGGGTPNFLTPKESKELFNQIIKYFPNFSKNSDISIEVDPRTTSLEHIKTYSELGFNRISMGVQDFDASVQKAINRLQTYEDTYKLCSDSRNLGLKNINIDLIYGLPEQDLKTFEKTIEQVLKIRPNRIALYGYAHVTWKQKVQKSFNKLNLPGPETRISLFLLALEMLKDSGYVHIGMDHFSLSNDELAIARINQKLNRNFMGYSTHKDLSILGFGASAVSTFKSLLCMNQPSITEYQKEIISNSFAVYKGIKRNLTDQIVASTIESILCHGEITKSKIESEWGIVFDNFFEKSLQKLLELENDGLVSICHEKISVSEIGKLFLRNIASCFDQYLETHETANITKFSQSV